MLDLVVIITVTEPEAIPGVADALARMRGIVLAEPGCVSWEALHSETDPERFVLVEHWQSRQAWEAHDDLDGIQLIYLPEVLPFVTREVHVSTRLGIQPHPSPNK